MAVLGLARLSKSNISALSRPRPIHVDVNDICLRHTHTHTHTHRHTHTHTLIYIVTHMHTVNSANERTRRPIVGARSGCPSLPPGDPTWEVDEVRRSVPMASARARRLPNGQRIPDLLESWSAPLLTSTAVIAPAPGTSRRLPMWSRAGSSRSKSWCGGSSTCRAERSCRRGLGGLCPARAGRGLPRQSLLKISCVLAPAGSSSTPAAYHSRRMVSPLFPGNTTTYV